MEEGKGGKEKQGSPVHQSMRESHFGTVHGAISSGFEDGEIICVSRVEEEGVDCVLFFPGAGEPGGQLR